MKISIFGVASSLLWVSIGAAALSAAQETRQGVTLTETPDTYTLANGIVTAKVQKRSGSLASLVYQGIEMLDPDARHAGGYWSHSAAGPKQTETITILRKFEFGWMNLKSWNVATFATERKIGGADENSSSIWCGCS